MQVSSRYLKRTQAKANEKHSLHTNLEEAEDKLKKALVDYRAARKEAGTWRDNFLEDLARKKSLHKGTEESNELKVLIQIEKQRKQARAVKRLQDKLNRNPTWQVQKKN